MFTIFVYRNVTFRLLSSSRKSFLFLSLERAQIRQTTGQFLSFLLSQSHLRNIFLHILTKTACGLLHHNQSGFRENHSCHTALTSLADQWLSSINDNTFCGPFLWTMICSFKSWQCIDCLRRRLRHFWYTERKLCMWMHPHPMYDLSNMEFTKVLFLDYYSFQFTSMTSLYISKHVVNFSQMTQQSTAVTLISESYRSHYKRVFAVY